MANHVSMSTMDGSSDTVDRMEPASAGRGGGLTSDAVIPVTIGVLAAAFSAALVVLVVVCRRRHCRYDRLQVSCDRYLVHCILYIWLHYFRELTLVTSINSNLATTASNLEGGENRGHRL